MDPSQVAHHFTKFYYETFDSDRSQLAPLYRPSSMLTFEGGQFLGAAQIIAKLTSLPFTKVRHNVTTVDAQAAVHPGAIVVNVTGYLFVDDGPNPLSFCQVFQLVNDGGSYYVFNDMFRLNVG